MIKVCLIGLGRTGTEIARVLLKQNDMELVMAVASESNPDIGKDLGELLDTRDTGITVTSCKDLEQNIIKFKPHAAIDFSSPEASVLNNEILSKMKVRSVIGTTGFSEIQTQKLLHLSRVHKTGTVLAPNITTGVNVMMLLTNLASCILEEYDCSITESHFKEKKDMPSGTAKKIAKEIIKGRDDAIFTDHNNADFSQIPIHSIRVGGVIGQHKVILAGQHDKIEITHESFSRTAFALGALKAVRYIYDKTGFFEMDDVLNFENALTGYLQKLNHVKTTNFGEQSV